MRKRACVAVVIPAQNEEGSIGRVIAAIPQWVDDIVVCDNGSTDRTPEVARAHGARVVFERHRGYGSACLTALAALERPDVVVFLDGDYSDHPEEMAAVVDPVLAGEADLVVGSRVRGRRARGALTPQARVGNWFACHLLRWVWGVRYTDLGPFRAIRFSALKRLQMGDPDFGWTAEMQVKAAIHGLRAIEVPVSYRRRIGRSKISGTLRGSVRAGIKIIYTILAPALLRSGRRRPRREACHLIVFARYPQPGVTKTRLIAALGADGAANLSHDMTRHTLDWADRLRKNDAVSVEVRFTGGSATLMQEAFGRDHAYVDQGDGDLGDRLARATNEAFARGAERVVVVGTDCPDLGASLARTAFQRLIDHDLTIGPADDGGYYLIGLRAPAPSLFAGVAWGTQTVLAETLARAAQSGLSYALTETLSDVDRPEDVELWERMHTKTESAPAGAGQSGREDKDTSCPKQHKARNKSKENLGSPRSN